MCEKAADLQKESCILEQNLYLIPSDVFILHDNFQFVTYGGRSQHGWVYFFLANEPPYVIFDKKVWERFIWLPRQDQLQDILDLDEKPYYLVRDFYKSMTKWEFRDGEYANDDFLQFTSIEQLWLIFVMREKFNKTWNGTDWQIGA